MGENNIVEARGKFISELSESDYLKVGSIINLSSDNLR